MVAVSYHDSLVKVQAPLGPRQGPFARRSWFELLERHGHRPVLAEAGTPAHGAALVLEEQGGTLRSLRHVFAFTWTPWIEANGQAALDAIARDLRRRAYRIEFEGLPEEDASGETLRQAFRRAGWIARLEAAEVNHVLRVKGRSFARYWQQRPGALRSALRRKGNKVTTQIIAEFDTRIWNEYEEVYASSWKNTETDITLLREFAMLEGAAGRLRLGVARHQGCPVAAQLWTVEEGTAYIHKLAYDQACSHLSPGTTLSAAMFERAIDDDRVDLIDFGTGDDRYKRDWMEEVRIRHRLTCIDPRQLRTLRFLLGKGLARLARPLQRG